MLNVNELEKLRSYDVEKIASAIGSSCRGAGYSDYSVFAAAYVLMRALEDFQISVDSMDYYFKTAEENETRELFIRQSLDGCWDSIRELKYRFSAEEFKALLLFYNGSGNRGWDSPTPDSVSRLAARLLNIKPGMKVLDVGTGMGGFIRECVALAPNASYTGLEINTEMAVIANIRAEILGWDIQIRLENLFDEDANDRQYDAVFANYPIGMRARGAGSLGEEYVRKLSEKAPGFARLNSLDWVFNRKAYDCISGPGRVICMMANGSTWNTIDRNARRYFMELGIVEMVITLPSRIYEAMGVGTTMIVFSHGNIKTMMVDASELCEKGRRMNVITDENIERILDACSRETEISRAVTFDEIAERQFNLSPTAYLEPEEEPIENGVELGSIVTITRGAQLQASVLDEMASDKVTEYQYLMLANIQNGIIDEELPYLREIDDKLEKYCLKNNNLILSKNGAPFKVAVADVQPGQHILANGNLYVMTVDETRADPYYLKAYLESEKGSAALKRITVGTTIPNLGVEQLKKLLIPLLPLDEQKRIADEYRACVTELKLLRRKTAKALDRMNHVYDNSREG